MPVSTKEDIEKIYCAHVDTVYRACFVYLKNREMDIEDAVQETFIRLIKSGKEFNGADHEKAWLIVAAANVCKNILKSKWNKDVKRVDQFDGIAYDSEKSEVIQSVLDLPQKYKTPVYLHYYEGYTTKEIAVILGKSHSNIRTLMFRARKMLKHVLEEEYEG